MDRSPQRQVRNPDKDTADRLEDDYTFEEFMADVCRDDGPCELCRRAALRRLVSDRTVP